MYRDILETVRNRDGITLKQYGCDSLNGVDTARIKKTIFQEGFNIHYESLHDYSQELRDVCIQPFRTLLIYIKYPEITIYDFLQVAKHGIC